jgi:hypothetical protein
MSVEGDYQMFRENESGDLVEVIGPNPRSGFFGDYGYPSPGNPEIVVEHDPVFGFTVHVIRRANIFELEELCQALQHCSRWQPTVSDEEAWMYE